MFSIKFREFAEMAYKQGFDKPNWVADVIFDFDPDFIAAVKKLYPGYIYAGYNDEKLFFILKDQIKKRR